MRANKIAACAAVVVGLALVVAPAANADQNGPISVELSKLGGIAEIAPDYWYVHGTDFEFAVTVKDTGTVNDENAFVFVSIPPEIEITGYNYEDRWTCVDVDGGVECENPDLVVPGEAWPVLTLSARGYVNTADTIDAYAHGQGPQEAHDGVRFRLDTSG